MLLLALMRWLLTQMLLHQLLMRLLLLRLKLLSNRFTALLMIGAVRETGRPFSFVHSPLRLCSQ